MRLSLAWKLLLGYMLVVAVSISTFALLANRSTERELRLMMGQARGAASRRAGRSAGRCERHAHPGGWGRGWLHLPACGVRSGAGRTRAGRPGQPRDSAGGAAVHRHGAGGS